MDDSNQILVPPSFLAVYSTPSGLRLREPAAFVRERYEMCEDLAQMLTEQASVAQFKSGGSGAEVLAGLRRALEGPDAGLQPGEAGWVVARLAELLGWEMPPDTAGEAPAQPGGTAPGDAA